MLEVYGFLNVDSASIDNEIVWLGELVEQVSIFITMLAPTPLVLLAFAFG